MTVVTDDEERDLRRHDFVRDSRRRIWRITSVACVAVLGLGLGAAAVIQQQASQEREQARDRALARRQTADIACVKRWANAYTRRADRINSLQQPKSDALDRLVEAIGDPAAFDRWRQRYLVASRLARLNAQENPLPPSPVFACGLVSRAPTPYRPSATSPRPRPPARPTSSPRTAGGSVAPSGSGTRRSSPANRDTSTTAGRARVAPSSRAAPRQRVPTSRVPTSLPVTVPPPPGLVVRVLPSPLCTAVQVPQVRLC